MAWSFVLEQLTLHHRVDEGADTVVSRGGALKDFFQLGTVSETDGRARGKSDELPGEVAGGGNFVALHERLELANAFERAPVWQLARRVDREAVVKRERLAAHAEAAHGRNIFGHGPITIAAAAHHIVA